MRKAWDLAYYAQRAERARRNSAYRSDEAKAEAERLMRFASRAGANPESLKRLSFLADFLGRGDLLKLREQIMEGRMEAVFPTERIVGKERDSAAEISNYLGAKRVDLCVKKALGEGNVEEASRAEKYLQWAAKNGAPGVRGRALAGLAILVSEKLKKQGNLFARGSVLAGNGSAKLLRAELGEPAADKILEERKRGTKIEPWAAIALSGCIGAGLGAGAGFLHELMGGRLELRLAIIYGVFSLAALAVVRISKARELDCLSKRIGKMLGKSAEAGQL